MTSIIIKLSRGKPLEQKNNKRRMAVMKNLIMLKSHLADNTGDENVTKMIWVVIVFVVGAILLALITGAFKGQITNWYNNVINSWFNEANGKAVVAGA